VHNFYRTFNAVSPKSPLKLPKIDTHAIFHSDLETCGCKRNAIGYRKVNERLLTNLEITAAALHRVGHWIGVPAVLDRRDVVAACFVESDG
jgi:hypothetical protein